MKRPILWATIFTICGIYLRLGRSEWICLVSFCIILIFSSRFVMKCKNWNYYVLLLFTVLGFLMAENSIEQKTAEESLFGVVQGNGVVTEKGMTSAGNQKMTITCELEDSTGKMLRNVKLYVIWSGEEIIHIGDIVEFTQTRQRYSMLACNAIRRVATHNRIIFFLIFIILKIINVISIFLIIIPYYILSFKRLKFKRKKCYKLGKVI